MSILFGLLGLVFALVLYGMGREAFVAVAGAVIGILFTRLLLLSQRVTLLESRERLQAQSDAAANLVHPPVAAPMRTAAPRPASPPEPQEDDAIPFVPTPSRTAPEATAPMPPSDTSETAAGRAVFTLEPIEEPVDTDETPAPARPTAPAAQGPAIRNAGSPRGWEDLPAAGPANAHVREQVRRPSVSARSGGSGGSGDGQMPAWVTWFTRGNVPVKVGMLLLLVGVGALLKYAADRGIFNLPIEFRLAGIAAAAVVALAFAWRKRESHRAFSLSLQGGALGILLLDVFAAYRLYGMMHASAAFGLVLLIVAGTVALAILQDAIWLALMGFLGGFLAPVLISTGSGDHVALFTYYAVLNGAVFAVAWFRHWRPLNLLGWVFTFGVGVLWGKQYYRPELLGTVEPFLILFFFFYLGIALLYALRRPVSERGFTDGTLVFGTPLLAFALQAALLADDRMALAYSALGLAVVYVGLFVWLRKREGLETLALSFAVLGLSFATLSVPLALSAKWTAGTWAVEGAALVWLGLRQNRRLPSFIGLGLQLLAGAATFFALTDGQMQKQAGEIAVFNGPAMSLFLVALGGIACARLLDTDRGSRGLSVFMLIWGLIWWGVLQIREIDLHAPANHEANVIVWLIAGNLLLWTLLRSALRWPRLSWVALPGFFLALFMAFASQAENHGVFSNFGFYPWLACVVAEAICLRMLASGTPARGLSWSHIAFLLLTPLLIALQIEELGHRHWMLGDGWVLTLMMLPLALVVVAGLRIPLLTGFPIPELFPRYQARWHAITGALFVVWLWVSCWSAGDTTPLTFIPLLNPIELGQLGVLGLLFGLLVRYGGWANARNYAQVLAGALFFIASMGALRGVHQLTGLAWSPDMLDSMLVQATLSVVWSVMGVSAWIYGSLRRNYPVWVGGALLMGVVLLKLILLDRTYLGDMPGIVAFISVGLLIVVVGYFAPSPPRMVTREESP